MEKGPPACVHDYWWFCSSLSHSFLGVGLDFHNWYDYEERDVQYRHLIPAPVDRVPGSAWLHKHPWLTCQKDEPNA